MNTTVITADRSCNQISYLIPDMIVLYIELALTLEILLVNVCILCIFIRKENRSPVTVLLLALATTDCLTALLTVTMDFCGYFVFSDDVKPTVKYSNLNETVLLWNRKYPSCVIFNVLDNIVYSCHMSSILITTLLCVQKALAILFPIWSQSYLTVKTSLIAGMVALLSSLSLFLPSVIIASLEMSSGSNGACCYSDKHISVVVDVLRNGKCNTWLNESKNNSDYFLRKVAMFPRLG
ncbi:CMKLR1 [Mytilus coruscus]|uniref:CMKLR1 n=1 Tax=Mytilus coruscus TaxID=42192 RepID=A0A6J8ES51_MYTCO|nr:CMKLR1 [Mytilus coruscus]